MGKRSRNGDRAQNRRKYANESIKEFVKRTSKRPPKTQAKARS